MNVFLGPLIDRLAKGPTILALLVSMLAVGFLLTKLKPRDQTSLDGQRFYPLSMIATLDDFEGDERWIYATRELTLDIAYPILYSLFGAALLTLLLQGVAVSHPWLYAMRWLPIVMAGFDAVENLGIATLLTWQGKKVPVLPVLTWLSSAGKWTFFYASLVALLVAVLVRLFLGGRPGGG